MIDKFLPIAFASAVLLITSSVTRSQSAEDLIAKGDVHYERLEAEEALKHYLPAEKLNPKNADLLVRISRQYRHLMSDAASTPEKLRLGAKAVEYANRAAALAPNDPEAHLAVAISYGKLVPLQGNRERVAAQPRVRAAAEKVTRLDPENDLGWHVLGRWYLTIAEVSGVKRALAGMVYGKLPPASFEDAERAFLRAIRLNPDRLMHYIELGRTYMNMGRKEEARKLINKGLAMRATEKDDPETKARGRALLAKLK
jgi:tetratricopeptide (TPR) repeat protein